MSEALQVALTAVAGVCIFVIGQIVQRFLIEPIQEQRRTIGRIAHATLYLANVKFLPDKEKYLMAETPQTASKILRDLAAQLRESTYLVPWYCLASIGGILVLRKHDIDALTTDLIGWSNHMNDDQSLGRNSRREAIATLLKLDPPKRSREGVLKTTSME